jgi:hypothetical protein
MNERIKELARQATDFVSYIPCVIDAEESKTIYTTKFAELIIKECARVVDIWSDEVPCSEGYDKFTVGKLKEHFGVEE